MWHMTKVSQDNVSRTINSRCLFIGLKTMYKATTKILNDKTYTFLYNYLLHVNITNTLVNIK